MENNRRNDIGNKVLMGVISMLVSVIMIFTIYSAQAALSSSNENKKDVAVLQQCIKTIDLSLAKMDLKLDTLLAIK